MRRLFNVLSAISFVLLAVTLTMWVVSYFVLVGATYRSEVNPVLPADAIICCVAHVVDMEEVLRTPTSSRPLPSMRLQPVRHPRSLPRMWGQQSTVTTSRPSRLRDSRALFSL